MNGFRNHEVSLDKKWSNFGRSDYTKPNDDGRSRRVINLQYSVYHHSRKEVSIHRAGLALCIDVTYRTTQGWIEGVVEVGSVVPRNKLVPSPVPKYTKMAIHRDSPVYSHFSILGHMASPVCIVSTFPKCIIRMCLSCHVFFATYYRSNTNKFTYQMV